MVCPPADSIAGPPACTQPGQGQVSKVFSVPGITFKGDGFYRNDSRAGAKSAAGSSNGQEKSDAAAAKSDSAAESADKPSKSPDREPAKAASGSTDD